MNLHEIKSVSLSVEVKSKGTMTGSPSTWTSSCAVGVIGVPVNHWGGDIRCAADVISEHAVNYLKRLTGLDIHLPDYSNLVEENRRLKEQLERHTAWSTENAYKVDAFNELLDLLGNVENGTSMIVKLFQEDATKDWFASVNTDAGDIKMADTGPTLAGAIFNLHAQLPKEEKDYED